MGVIDRATAGIARQDLYKVAAAGSHHGDCPMHLVHAAQAEIRGVSLSEHQTQIVRNRLRQRLDGD